MSIRAYLFSALLLPLSLSPAPAAPPPEPPPAGVALADFGAIDSAAHAQATYDKAVQSLRQTGGLLMVPASAWKLIKDQPLQGLIRTPAGPEMTKSWKEGPGVTVMVVEEKQSVLHLPPLAGLKLDRQFRLAEGDSSPHWGTHPMLTLDSNLVYGAISYLDWIQAPVEKGKDRRFYVATIRGIRVGEFLNLHGGPGYGGGVTRGYVKSLGYDAEKKMPYFVADTDRDHVAGAIVQNKTNAGLIHMKQTSHNDNQTYDVKVIRNQYAHGDTYIYYCDFNYMSNVHSAAGDENGNCYAAFIRSLDNNFRGKVESVDWTEARLNFDASARNVDTLGDSRPLINRNPKKAITTGQVYIVAAEGSHENIDPAKCVFEGKHYPTQLTKNPITGNKELKIGGLIRAGKDCPWTPEIVGRYFALTDKEEMTPKGNLRWYLITALRQRDDGTKEIEIQRFWWGAKSAGSPTLYRTDSYTWDGHLKPLNYIIAPGAYVSDVSRAIPGGDRGGQRTLGLAPYVDASSPSDFEKGDEIEQAIGPDPFRPQAMRVWMWEDIPGEWPSAVFDLANYGAASKYAAMTIGGGPASLEECAKRQQQKPAWDNVLIVNSAATNGLNFKADFANAALYFQQPNAEQPIKWRYAAAEGTPPKEASLTVSRATGELNFQGNGIRPNGPVTNAAGLSGDTTPARNLRGKNLAVDENGTTLRVRFATPESDADYAVFVEQTWLTNRAIVEKTPEGFTVQFEKPAPKAAKADWMIVR